MLYTLLHYGCSIEWHVLWSMGCKYGQDKALGLSFKEYQGEMHCVLCCFFQTYYNSTKKYYYVRLGIDRLMHHLIARMGVMLHVETTLVS